MYKVRYNSLVKGKRIEYYKDFKTKKTAQKYIDSIGWHKNARPRIVRK